MHVEIKNIKYQSFCQLCKHRTAIDKCSNYGIHNQVKHRLNIEFGYCNTNICLILSEQCPATCHFYEYGGYRKAIS